MKAENYATIEFASRSVNEGFGRMAAACFAAQLDPTLDEVNDIKTAVSEAVTNAIVHGYPQKIGKIVMKLRLKEDNTDFVNELAELPGVCSAVLVSYNGEYMG